MAEAISIVNNLLKPNTICDCNPLVHIPIIKKIIKGFFVYYCLLLTHTTQSSTVLPAALVSRLRGILSQRRIRTISSVCLEEQVAMILDEPSWRRQKSFTQTRVIRQTHMQLFSSSSQHTRNWKAPEGKMRSRQQRWENHTILFQDPSIPGTAFIEAPTRNTRTKLHPPSQRLNFCGKDEPGSVADLCIDLWVASQWMS